MGFMDKIFGSKIEEEVKKTESGAVNKEVSKGLAEGTMQMATESEIANIEAMNIIKGDKRLTKAYDSWAGVTDSKGKNMQEKYLQAVLKYGENVGGYDKQTEEFRKGTFSSVPEMGGGGSIKEDVVMTAIQDDKMLKKAYESWNGRADSKGNDMQKKFKNFVAEHPGMAVGYDKKTEEFRAQGYQFEN